MLLFNNPEHHGVITLCKTVIGVCLDLLTSTATQSDSAGKRTFVGYVPPSLENEWHLLQEVSIKYVLTRIIPISTQHVGATAAEKDTI
jgi:hypothetical protein